MAYTKQTWVDLPSKTTPINAERLTYIEDGIYNAADVADSAYAGLDNKQDVLTEGTNIEISSNVISCTLPLSIVGGQLCITYDDGN